MTVICGNAGVPIGSESCKLCVSHGCEGYRKATKQNKEKFAEKRLYKKIIEALKIFIGLEY